MMRKVLGAVPVCAAVFVLGVQTAWAAPASSWLRWSSAKYVMSGTPVSVSSISPCPVAPSPTAPRMVGFFLSFGGSGGSGQTLSVGTDGSWGGTVVFTFTGVTLKSTTLSATCDYYNGTTFVPYTGSNYDVHKVRLG